MQQIDSFIGSEFTTPKGGIIRVLSRNKESGRYDLSCSKCNSDTEMWPSGSISSLKGDLISGRTPCGCSTRPTLSERQATVVVSRALLPLGYKLNGFVGGYSGAKTKCIITCDEHGIWNSSAFYRARHGVQCPGCVPSVISRKNTKPQSFYLDKIRTKTNMLDGARLYRSKSCKWVFVCDKCVNDDYAVSGAGPRYFYTTAGHLLEKKKPCRCSSSYRMSDKELTRRMQVISSGRDVEFLRLLDCETNRDRKAVFRCGIHGEYYGSIRSFIFNGAGCGGCAHGGFDDTANGSLYALKSECGAYLKIGIANIASKRLASLRAKTPFKFDEVVSFSGHGSLIRQLEGQTHRSFMSAGLSGFCGATEWMRYDPEIISFIDEKSRTWRDQSTSVYA